MSDKKVLKESTIRKMMKLANIPALSEKFIQENYYTYNEQDEVEVEDEIALDAPMEEPPMDDVEVDAEIEIEEPAGDDLPAAEQLVTDLMSVIEDHFPEVVIDVDTEESGDEEVEIDAEVELEEPMPEEPLDDMDGEEELDMDMDIEEEEPVLEEVPGNLADLGAMGAGEAEEEKADADVLGEDELEECGEVAEMEDEVEVVDAPSGLNSDLIDAIAAKVAERLLAEAKKTNK